MKKCPYCKEEIQEEAIKCRFCGEWLVPKQEQSDMADRIVEKENSDVNKTEANNTFFEESAKPESKTCPNCQRINLNSAQKCDCGYNFITKILESSIKDSKNLWGWGWLILVGMYGYGFSKANFQARNENIALILTAIEAIGGLAILGFYFWLRRKILRKQKYLKTWHASLLTGLIAYFVGALLVGGAIGLIMGLDNRAALKNFNNSANEFRRNMLPMNQEEDTLWQEYSKTPISDTRKNIETMSMLLDILNKKNLAFNKFLKDFKYIVHLTKDIALENRVKELETTVYDYFAKARKGIELTLQYFYGGDEEKFKQGEKLFEDVKIIQEKMASLLVNLQAK